MSGKIGSDVAVIGGGPGGYVAAIRAAQLGGKVALIEKARLGGVCTNVGCIPTKALLHVCEVIDNIEKSDKFGIKVEKYSVNYESSLKWTNQIINRLSKGVEHLLIKNDVKVIRGFGKIKGKNLVEVDLSEGGKTLIDTKNIIIATGSSPAKPPIKGIDLEKVITSDEAFKLDQLPKSIGVIGGGAVGLEFATIFKAFGAESIVLEMMKNILPNEDEEASGTLKQILERKGIKIVNEATVKELSASSGNLEMAYNVSEKEQRLKVESVLVAAGRSANVKNMGFEQIGLKVHEGRLAVDNNLRTNIPNIYAIGDVVNKWMLAHVAMQEGIVASENAMGLNSTMNHKHIPRCVYTKPELAAVGLTEAEAKKEGKQVGTANYPLIASGRAVTLDERNGFIKIIFDKKFGEILGVQIVAPDASELIHEFVLAMRLEATVDEIANLIHAHPTLAEASREAALKALDRSIHV